MNSMTKTLSLGLMTVVGAFSLSAAAPETKNEPAIAAWNAAHSDIEKSLGFVPNFLEALPVEMLPGTWEEMKTLQMNPGTALPGKVKELIGLGVAAQIPCTYCIEAHTEFAKLNGACEQEIGQAVGMAAITRHWSTYINGIQQDEGKFRSEISRLVEGAKKAAASGAPAPKGVAVTDGASAPKDGAGALKDIAATLGFAPDFMKRFPDVARAGAWKTFKDVQLNPATELSGKDKELVGLAVASQIPCKFCIIAHTEFAKLNGASEAEIDEAIAMASLTRELSTMLNGLQVDKAQFHADIQKIVKNVQATAAKEAKTKKTAVSVR
jgi:AhpD family alkylhydroperoxidase